MVTAAEAARSFATSSLAMELRASSPVMAAEEAARSFGTSGLQSEPAMELASLGRLPSAVLELAAASGVSVAHRAAQELADKYQAAFGSVALFASRASLALDPVTTKWAALREQAR
jgi:hypothetical protein